MPTSPDGGLQERMREMEDTHQALLNILEDFAAEKARLEEVQRAVMNILEDFGLEKTKVSLANRELRRQMRKRERAEEALREHRDRLEALVQERTTELQASNRQLLDEVAERRRTEDAVRKTNAELERLSRLKDEFLSLASHELKTPITSIKIFCDLVAHGYGIQPELVAMLGRQSDHLVRLVNDLLEVSRLQLGCMPLESRSLNLVELVSRLCAQHRYVCSKHKVTCAQDCDKITVMGDAVRLEQVFSNLLENAHKFTPQAGEIVVRVGRRAGKAVVEVKDEGVGIEPECLPRVFELFFKPASQQAKAQFPGLGVGLYICRNIAERHGGRIWAESEGEGKGSRFFVELPLAPNEAD